MRETSRGRFPARIVAVTMILLLGTLSMPAMAGKDGKSKLMTVIGMLDGLSMNHEATASPFLPPGHGGTPPGQGGTPPGQTTPPGQGGTPPGQGDTPPGQGGGPPPGHQDDHPKPD